MNIDHGKLTKMVIFLAILCVMAGTLARTLRKSSESLKDYAETNPEIAYTVSGSDQGSSGPESSKASGSSDASASKNSKPIDLRSRLAAALLNTAQPEENYTLYSEGFYYAPLSDQLRQYLTEKFTQTSTDASSGDAHSITPVFSDDLCYLHIWYFDPTGSPVEGELLCNRDIAGDLAEIFCELYRNKYRLENVLLPSGSGTSFQDCVESNTTICYVPGYRYDLAPADFDLSAGNAVLINPAYNPLVSYDDSGIQSVFPDSASDHADRDKSFAYKLDSSDLCYRLFTEHGFRWGGDRSLIKNYGYFEKELVKTK